MKKKILLVLSFLAVIGLSVGGTIAYFTAQDAEVATFTYGNVKIEQLQYERVVENGEWISMGESNKDQWGYIPDKIQQVTSTQGSAILPAVYQNEKNTMIWDDRNGSEAASGEGSHQQSWGQLNAPGSNQLFDDSVRNVVDRFTFVKNTGNEDAYVRTWVAFEQGNISEEQYERIIHVNQNESWWDKTQEIYDYEIADEETGKVNKYYVICYEFKGENADNRKAGIQTLSPNAITRPSLLQFYLDPTTTGEEVELMDGNGNGQLDVITISQAVQAEGFNNAQNAFDKAFGTNLPF